jgi:PAS domain S-box-containing protein
MSRSTLGRYSLGLIAVAVALLLRKLLDPVLGDYTPYITLYPTMVFLAMYLGVGPSVVAATLGALGATYWFVEPRGSFHISDVSTHVVGTLSFFVVSVCIIGTGEVSRRSQARLRRTKALFETFLDNSPGIEFLKDASGRYVYVNRAARSLFRQDSIGEIDFIGKTDFELLPAAFASQRRTNDLVVLEQNKATEFIETTPHPDGEHTWLSVKFPVVDADGRKLLGGKSVDITEIKRAERDITTLVEAVPTGLARYSRDRRYVWANSAYAQITGLPLEQIIGRHIVDVIGPDVWAIKRPYVKRVLRGERVEFENLLPFAAAGPRQLHLVYTPEKDGDEVVGWVASVTDITEVKRLEKQLRDVEKMAAAGQLAASLAHEINNPLMAVVNVLYLLRNRSDLDPAATGLISTANNEIARVTRIVKQSLSYYRAGPAEEVDFVAVIEESLQALHVKSERAGVAISKKITETSVIGFADEIRQVVDNLLVNAVEATPPGGRLVLCLRQMRNWKNHGEVGARLTIGDNGCGIPKARLSRVFEPFFTTKPDKGKGLGLWVVKGIIHKNGGSIKIRSTDAAARSGTVVSIFWPSAVIASPRSKMPA